MRHTTSPRPLAAAAAAVAVALLPTAAHAQYLDPGAGSIIVQAVIAVVIGVAATARLYWHRISLFLSRRKSGDQD